MQLASGTHIPDGLLAANALLSEKLHQGSATSTRTLHQSFGVVISHTSLGISRSLYDGRVRCRYTGKERDTESGNDYFDARYYSSSMGRFMSPDWSAKEEPVPYATMDDPQSLNLYSYVRNNPLSKADPDGHCPECIVWADEAMESPEGQAVANFVGATAAAGFAIVSGLAGDVAHAYAQAGGPASTGMYPTTMNSSSSEQGRDAGGKFLPKEAGQTQPGAAGEKEGLASEGATKNTQALPGSNRIPDGTKPDGQKVEVKTGQSVSNTGQLKEMGKAAVAATGKPLVVVTTNPNVNVSKPALQNPDLVHKPLNQ